MGVCRCRCCCCCCFVVVVVVVDVVFVFVAAVAGVVVVAVAVVIIAHVIAHVVVAALSPSPHIFLDSSLGRNQKLRNTVCLAFICPCGWIVGQKMTCHEP